MEEKNNKADLTRLAQRLGRPLVALGALEQLSSEQLSALDALIEQTLVTRSRALEDDFSAAAPGPLGTLLRRWLERAS